MVVVGLGPAGAELVPPVTTTALAAAPVRLVRTRRHPAAVVVPDAVSFDEVYDTARDLDDVYGTIVERIGHAAHHHGHVAYAVPGSPLVAERTVALLRARDDLAVEVLPALSFLDLAWVALGVDPLAAGVRLVDGHRFAVEAAGERGPLLVAQCDDRFVLSDIKLAVEDGPSEPVVVLHHLGLPDQQVTAVAWDELDRVVDADHLTTLWIPTLAAPVGAELVRFAEVVRRLRAECPWDRAQTHGSLRRYAIEETAELVDAIDEFERTGDDDGMIEELGDVLLQVFLHAAVAAEDGRFTLADVAVSITEKMVRRHPHVFGDVVVDGADDVHRNWEAIKAAEKADRATDPFAGVAAALPALALLQDLLRTAAKHSGFDWPSDADAVAKVREELDEVLAAWDDDVHVAEELGDLLAATVDLARRRGVTAEVVARGAAGKFRRRYEHMDRAARARGTSLAELDLGAQLALWGDAKHAER